jgi:hypothetical protein
VDYCHPNHPDCVTGVTCSDCGSGFNPHYIISGNLVTYSNALYIPVGEEENNYFGVSVYPNPSNGIVNLSSYRNNLSINAFVKITNLTGQVMEQFKWDGQNKTLDMTAYSKGVYLIIIKNGSYMQAERIILR